MVLSFSLSLATMMWLRKKDELPASNHTPAPSAAVQSAAPMVRAAALPVQPPPAAVIHNSAPAATIRPGTPQPGAVAITEILAPKDETDYSGNFIGVRVTPGPDAATFIRSGLKGGDVISAINGTKLDPEHADEMLNLLGTGTTVTVLRRNKTFDVTLNFAP